jgi:hypothetical protein
MGYVSRLALVAKVDFESSKLYARSIFCTRPAMPTRYEGLSAVEFAALPREEQRRVLREHEAQHGRAHGDRELEALIDEELDRIRGRLRLAGRLEDFERFAARRRWAGLPRVPWSWAIALLILALALFLVLRWLR